MKTKEVIHLKEIEKQSIFTESSQSAAVNFTDTENLDKGSRNVFSFLNITQ